MNAYKLNGMVGHVCREAICRGLGIPFSDIYLTVKHIDNKGTIYTKDGRAFKLKLEDVGIIEEQTCPLLLTVAEKATVKDLVL